MNGPPTGSPVNSGLSLTPRLNTIMTNTMAASRRAPRSWTMLPLFSAQPLEPDHHGEQQRDVERGLGERARAAIGVAGRDNAGPRARSSSTVNRMAAASTMRAGTSSAWRRSMMAGEPERRRRHAIAIEQPVEDRRGADGVADDARVPDDAPQHGDGDGGGKPAERRPGRSARRPRQCPAPSARARR